MKTWEMIKKLTENPKLKFKHKYRDYIVSCPENFIDVRLEASNTALAMKITDEWEVIEEPVPWQEAIQGWIDGKQIRCDVDNKKHFFKAGKYLDAERVIEYFKKGKWYIGEGEQGGKVT